MASATADRGVTVTDGGITCDLPAAAADGLCCRGHALPDHQAFVIPWTPTAKGRPRTTIRGGHALIYTPNATRAAERGIRDALRAAGAVMYPARVPLHLTVRFGIPKPVKAPKYLTHSERRPDLPNYLMLVCDAGTGVLWADDAQISSCAVEKVYAPAGGPSQLVIGVKPMPFAAAWWWDRIVHNYAMDPRD